MTMKYAAILDAGSSGTRLFIYRWKPWKDGDPAPPVIELVYSKQKDKGIADLWNDSYKKGELESKVKEYLEVLLAQAKAFSIGVQVDPECFPLFLMGTAGLRDFEKRARNEHIARPNIQDYDRLMKSIKGCMEAEFPSVHCEVITGKFEAIYGWVAANYTLGSFSGNPQTVGYLEMGGASAQIAFCPHKNLGKDEPYYAGDMMCVCVGASAFFLYAESYPLGANEAWKCHNELLQTTAGSNDTIIDWARPYGFEEKGNPVKGPAKWDREPWARLKEIRKAAREVLDKLEERNMDASSPLLLDDSALVNAIKNHHFVGGASFWYTTRKLFGLDHEGRTKDTPFKYADFRQEVLDTVDFTWDVLVGPRMEEKGHKEKFLERAWFSAEWIDCVLVDGFGLPSKDTRNNTTQVQGEKITSVQGQEAGQERGDTTPVQDENKASPSDKEEVELSFQPYNGPDGAELSWTLGKIVLLATGDETPEPVSGGDAFDTMSIWTTHLRRTAIVTHLRGKSKELGYRRDSYLEHMGKATGSQKVTFQQRADVCDAWSVHYEQEAEKVEMAPTGDEHICVPPPRISSDSFLYA